MDVLAYEVCTEDRIRVRHTRAWLAGLTSSSAVAVMHNHRRTLGVRATPHLRASCTGDTVGIAVHGRRTWTDVCTEHSA